MFVTLHYIACDAGRVETAHLFAAALDHAAPQLVVRDDALDGIGQRPHVIGRDVESGIAAGLFETRARRGYDRYAYALSLDYRYAEALEARRVDEDIRCGVYGRQIAVGHVVEQMHAVGNA